MVWAELIRHPSSKHCLVANGQTRPYDSCGRRNATVMHTTRGYHTKKNAHKHTLASPTHDATGRSESMSVKEPLTSSQLAVLFPSPPPLSSTQPPKLARLMVSDDPSTEPMRDTAVLKVDIAPLTPPNGAASTSDQSPSGTERSTEKSETRLVKGWGCSYLCRATGRSVGLVRERFESIFKAL